MLKSLTLVSFLSGVVLLPSCVKTGPGSTEITSDIKAQTTMERVALSANKCWFKPKDKAFTSYRLAPELNSYSGRPRILVVPIHNPAALPLLVIEAEGNPAKVQLYGNLMGDVEGNRIIKDVKRWIKGDEKCQ